MVDCVGLADLLIQCEWITEHVGGVIEDVVIEDVKLRTGVLVT